MSVAASIRLFASVSRFHIVAIAALGTFTFGWLFTGDYPWLIAGICALDWFLVNLLNRVVDLKEDQANAIFGTEFVAEHRRVVMYGGFAILFGSIVAGHFVVPEITPLRLCFHTLGFAYNWPLLPGGRRIKQLYFWKNTASAIGFMITVFGYALSRVGWGLDATQLAPGITLSTILFSAGFFMLFELSYEVIYDLRDAKGDALASVRTYPVVHGERGAMRIIDALIVTSLSFLIVGYATGVVPWRIFVMLVAPAIQLAVYKRWVRRGITSTDCTRLTWLGTALLASYHLWVVTGLPGVGLPT